LWSKFSDGKSVSAIGIHSERCLAGNESLPGTVGMVPLVPCGWPFPMLKYKYVFQIEYTEAILFYQTTRGNRYGLKLPKMLIAVQFKTSDQ